MTIETYADDQVARQLYWKGWSGYQPEVTPLFFDFAVNAACVVDIGAYIGFYALLAAHANPSARVYAFEPSRSIFARLQRNVELNDVRVECRMEACGAQTGTALLAHPRESCPSSSSLSSAFVESRGVSEAEIMTYAVPLVALDDFLAEPGADHVDLVKLDAEGAEGEVLRGMQEVLMRDRPTIFCEILPDTHTAGSVDALLRPLGYSFFALTESGPISQASPEPSWDAVDYLLTVLEPATVVKRWSHAQERALSTSTSRLTGFSKRRDTGTDARAAWSENRSSGPESR